MKKDCNWLFRSANNDQKTKTGTSKRWIKPEIKQTDHLQNIELLYFQHQAHHHFYSDLLPLGNCSINRITKIIILLSNLIRSYQTRVCYGYSCQLEETSLDFLKTFQRSSSFKPSSKFKKKKKMAQHMLRAGDIVYYFYLD